MWLQSSGLHVFRFFHLEIFPSQLQTRPERIVVGVVAKVLRNLLDEWVTRMDVIAEKDPVPSLGLPARFLSRTLLLASLPFAGNAGPLTLSW